MTESIVCRRGLPELCELPGCEGAFHDPVGDIEEEADAVGLRDDPTR